MRLPERVTFIFPYGGYILVGSLLGVLVAYLVANGSWQIALGAILAVAALILLHRYPLLALFIWLILAEFLMTTQTGAERRAYWAIHRALPPIAVGILLLSHYLNIRRRTLPRITLAEFAMLGYLGASYLSILLQNETPQATSYFLYDRVFIPMCLYSLVRLSSPGEKDIHRLVPVVLFVCVAQSIIGILSWTAPQILPKAWLTLVGLRATGSLDSYSVYSSTLIFCALLILHAALNMKPGWRRTGYMAAFLLALFCVFLSFSRGSWLGGVLVLLGLVYLYPRFMLRLGLVLLLVLILLGAGILSNYLQFAGERINSRETALSRLPVFYASIQMFQSKPLFGWGYGNFDQYDRRFQGRVGDLVSPEKDHASHNFYLTLFAEQGLSGFFLFMAPMFWWLFQTTRAFRKLPEKGFWSRHLLLIFWLVILDHLVVNNFSNMREVYGLGIWWVTLGLIGSVASAGLGQAAAEPLAPYASTTAATAWGRHF